MKGESLHALRRDLFFAHQGHVRRRHLDDQVDQALCLTLVTNTAVLWTTTYLGDALDALRADGYNVTDETAAHLTPAQHDDINFYGTYSFDVETELQRKGTPANPLAGRLSYRGTEGTRFATLLRGPLETAPGPVRVIPPTMEAAGGSGVLPGCPVPRCGLASDPMRTRRRTVCRSPEGVRVRGSQSITRRRRTVALR
jgi:hypothetical protein